ncbi:MAG TPA: hypothetical protein VMD91_11280 [Candidatus Sulfotelmatobacter sp.]|nr:hypothetical protein [Candidatus Sulfotelmatobacter sp.]
MDRTDRNREKVETVKADTRDLVDEAKERTLATGERAKRAVAGGSMSPGEHVVSHAKELGHDVKANIDKGARETRDEIEREP